MLYNKKKLNESLTNSTKRSKHFYNEQATVMHPLA